MASELEELLSAKREFVMDGVRELTEGYPVNLVRLTTTGRLCVEALNECRNRNVYIDLEDLLNWLSVNGYCIKIESEERN